MDRGRLVIFGPGKMIATISPGVGEGDLGMPRGVAVDDSGKLQLDGAFEYPNGVATDKRAHVYITDREDNRVQVWGY
jgi:hypothetical protein